MKASQSDLKSYCKCKPACSYEEQHWALTYSSRAKALEAKGLDASNEWSLAFDYDVIWSRRKREATSEASDV